MASDTGPFGSTPPRSLLAANDAMPVFVINPGGSSSFLLIGDHAGNRIPSRLGTLGVGEVDLARHIGWDIGVGALGEALAKALDAPFVRQTYSRLVVDCNRAPDAADAIAPVSDGIAIPGNAATPDDERAARFAEIHEPYHVAIAGMIDSAEAAGKAPVLIALHSFTPVMRSVPRPWHIGILHDRGDPRFAIACLEALKRLPDLVVGDNEPYRMDAIDYTVPRHAYPRGIAYVEIEIRQDLLSDEAQVAQWTALLTDVFTQARKNGAQGRS